MSLYRRATHGAEAGLLAGGAVVALFLFQDAVRLAPLATPSALTQGFFGPGGVAFDTALLAQAAAMVGTGMSLLAYTVLHFLTFALVGVSAAFVLGGGAWWGAVAGGALYGVTVCTGAFYGARYLLHAPIHFDQIGLPTVLVANLVAGVVMGGGLYLVRGDGEEDAEA